MSAAEAETALAVRFRRFAERECAGISPLYHALALAIAGEPVLLDLAARARHGQPPANMLLAAVHALLLRGPADASLARFYPSLAERPEPAAAAFPAFRAFCVAQEARIVEILEKRVVSTNEVQRSACLLPGFLAVAARCEAPLHLVEVGASAGLNLLWDRYGYDYGGGPLGPADAPLRLRCALRGGGLPPDGTWPRIASRVGIDSDPLDPRDPGDAAWLRALIWPEQRTRAERLRAALAIAVQAKPSIFAGDALDRLPEAIAALPAGVPLCLVHSFTLNQFDEAARGAFFALLERLGRDRPLYRIGLEWGEAEAPELVLAEHHGRDAAPRRLALCDAHGAWIDLL